MCTKCFLCLRWQERRLRMFNLKPIQLCVCVYMCGYVCIYVHVYVYVYNHRDGQVDIWIYIYMKMCTK